MTKMNAGTWIGLIGALVGILVAIGAVIATTGSTAPYIVGAMLLLFAGMFFLFYKLIFAPMINARRLMKTGHPGKGVIRKVIDTGITVNNSPQVKLLLEIKNSFGQRYETSVRTLVSRLNPLVYRPGMEVPVKIDPNNEMNVIIDHSVAATHTSTQQAVTTRDEQALKLELEQMQQANETIALGGRPARAIVKKYTWLEANVNGQNPYVELEVEVLPEHSSSFSAVTRGVIAETSVPKFQPGSEIWVKYDFYDNSKVVIDRSK